MTGFGRAEHATEQLVARVEVSSVNRKQGEVVVQLPRAYSELDAGIRKFVLSKLSRGRVSVAITLEKAQGTAAPIQVDLDRAKALSQAMERIADAVGQPLTLTASDFLQNANIVQYNSEECETDTALTAIQPALEEALNKLLEMRSREGEDLKQDTLQRIETLEATTAAIASHAPSVAERYRDNLHKRLQDSGLAIDLNDDRVLKEVGIFAERCDITEELTRLDSHFAKFREYLAKDEPVGRSLDFLCQEINREFNTIGSKANDATLAQHVVNAKTELEKVREQIQNVE